MKASNKYKVKIWWSIHTS